MKTIIEKMARLARIELSEKEKARFEEKTGHVLQYVKKLGELETEKVEPTSHAIEVVNAFREDLGLPFDKPEKITSLAPAIHDNLFEVPKVFDED